MTPEFNEKQALRARVEEQDAEIERLRKENQALESTVDVLGHPVDSPCGHSSIYAVSDDGGAHIRCLICREAKLVAEVESLRSELAQVWEQAAKECDRFLEKLRGRNNDRSDGAFVAITRLARNLRARAAQPERDFKQK